MTTFSVPCRPSVRTFVGLLVSALAFWIIITQASLVLEMSLVLFGAFLLSLALRPLAVALARKHIPRGMTVLLVYLGLVGGVALLASLLVPVIRSEVSLLQTNGPDLFRKALSQIQATPAGRFIPSTDSLASSLSQHVDALLTTVVSAITSLGEVAVDLLIVLILTYFFVTDVGLGGRLLNGWLPDRYRPRAQIILGHLQHRLTRWIWAQFAIAVYFAVAFSVGMRLLGVPFAFTIGTVGGVLELVPYLGGIVAVLLAAVSALTVHPLLVVWVVLFHIVVVEVEAHVIAPTFYGRIVGLHPAVILVALLIGTKSKGLLGVLFAVPIAVVVLVFLQELRTMQTQKDIKLPAGGSGAV